jgi:hypothetical protein
MAYSGTGFEFQMEFRAQNALAGVTEDGAPAANRPAEAVATVAMSPQAFKSMVNHCRAMMERYEKTFGTIPDTEAINIHNATMNAGGKFQS